MVLLSTMSDFGLSWDEPTRWRSGDQKLDYYKALITSTDKLATLRTAPKDVYPGLYDIPLALLRRNVDVDPILLSRLFNCLFGLLAVAGTFRLARTILPDSQSETDKKTTRFASLAPYFAVFTLLAFPEFSGHILINPKDIPFAATYVWGLYAIARLTLSLPKPSLWTYARTGLLIGLCMATRPPGVVLIGYAGMALLTWALFYTEKPAIWKRLGDYAVGGVLITVVAVVTLLPWWPAAHRNPFASSIEAVGTLRTYSKTIPVLFQGEIFSAGSTPWYYVAWMFLVKSPVWILALLGLGLAGALKRIRSGVPRSDADARLALIKGVIAFSIVFPFVYVLVKQPAIHNGFRHMLYVLPPLAVLLAWAWQDSMAWLAKRNRTAIGIAATSAVFIYTAFLQINLFPYQYVYYNELSGGTSGALNRYETEYWFTSGKESVNLLKAALGKSQSSPETKPLNLMTSGPWQVLQPYLPEAWKLVGNAEEADYYIGNTQMRADLLVEGTEVGRIERMGLPIVVIKKLRETE